MGLFSSKTKHRYSTSVTRIMEDDLISDMRKSVPIQAILNNLNLVGAYKRHALKGSFRRFEAMHRFAATEGNYIHGLMNASITSPTQGTEKVQAAVEDDVEFPVTMSYSVLGGMNSLHHAWTRLQKDYDYDFESNEVRHFSRKYGVPVYLENITLHHKTDPDFPPEEGSFDTIQGCDDPKAGYTPERMAQPYGIDWSRTTPPELWEIGEDLVESAVISLIWEKVEEVATDNGGLVFIAPDSVTNSDGTLNLGEMTSESTISTPQIHREDLVIDFSGYELAEEYFHARYTYVAGGKTYIGYWTYQVGTGNHPALDAHLEASYTEPGSYFPIVPFIREGYALTQGANARGTEAKSSIKLLNKIELNFLDIGDAIHKQDTGDVTQCLFMMGVPMDTDDPVELDYLYEFFNDALNKVKQGNNYGDAFAMRFTDAGFQMTLSVGGIRSDLLAYNSPTNTSGAVYRKLDIPPPSEDDAKELLRKFQANEISVSEYLDSTSGGRKFSLFGGWGNYGGYTLYKQVTPQVVHKITISRAKVGYIIYRNRGTSADAYGANMLIPLDYKLAKKMTYLDRERLYQRSMHIVTNTHTSTNAGFLGSIGFKIIIIIIAILTALPSGGQSITAALAILATSAGLMAFVINLVLFQVVMKIAFEKIIEWFGLDVAILLIIVAAATGYLAQTGKLVGMVSSSTGETLLQIASNMVSNLNNNAEIAALQKEMEAFKDSSESQLAELKEINKTLTPQNLLNPYAFISREPMFIPGEDPGSLYARTVNSGNIGVNSLKIIENYVDISLTLPTIDETINRG